ncbi:hypothetical protein [Pseudalkalibacillus berkeleyi]|nr:hypothetical protein [Pseudalkalibacillus berkeleyi]
MMLHLFRYVVIGFFSITAMSLVAFQAVEIFQAFMEIFFTDMKSK